MKIRQYQNEDLSKRNKIVLLPGEIHIWVIRWNRIADFLSEYMYVLSAKERERIAGFRFDEDRMRCAAGKIVVRLLLEQYLGAESTKIRICKEKNGKPYHQEIDGKKSVQFSISHSGDIVLMGFTYFPKLGVDVEQIRRLLEYREIAHNFFTKEESEEVEKHRTVETFYKYWTAKEAYLKATGSGLAGGMDSFTVKNGNIIRSGKIQRDWKMIPIKIDDEYAAYAAVQEKGAKQHE